LPKCKHLKEGAGCKDGVFLERKHIYEQLSKKEANLSNIGGDWESVFFTSVNEKSGFSFGWEYWPGKSIDQNASIHLDKQYCTLNVKYI